MCFFTGTLSVQSDSVCLMQQVDEYHGSRDQHSLSAFIRSKSGLKDSRKEQEARTEEEEKELDDGVGVCVY